MGLRFRKSAGLGKSTRLNISKSGVGISSGVGNARKSISSSGRSRTTISAPGTGVSFVKEGGKRGRKAKGGPLAWIAVVVLAVIIIGLGKSGTSDTTAKANDPAEKASVESTVEQRTVPEPAQEEADPAPAAETAPEETAATDPAPEPAGEPAAASEANAAAEPHNTQSEAVTFVPTAEPAAAPSEKTTPVTSAPSAQYRYVGSVDSNKYHDPSCRYAKKILPENLIGWDSVQDAQAAGYQPCGTCRPS